MKVLLLLISILFSQEVAVITFNSNISEVLNVELRSPTDVKYGETQIQIPGEYANIKGHKIRILNAHVQDCFILRWFPLLPQLDTITVDNRSCTVYYHNVCNTGTENKVIAANTSNVVKHSYDVLGRKITNKRRVHHIRTFRK